MKTARMKITLRLSIAAFGLATFNLSAATLYVWQDSPSPAPTYAKWITAAHTVQDAVDAAQAGDTGLVAGGACVTDFDP